MGVNRTYNHYCRWREREKGWVVCRSHCGKGGKGILPKIVKQPQRSTKKCKGEMRRNILFHSSETGPEKTCQRDSGQDGNILFHQLQGAFSSMDCAYFLYPKADLEMGLLNYSAFVTCHFLSPPLRLRSIPDASIVSPPPPFTSATPTSPELLPPFPVKHVGRHALGTLPRQSEVEGKGGEGSVSRKDAFEKGIGVELEGDA